MKIESSSLYGRVPLATPRQSPPQIKPEAAPEAAGKPLSAQERLRMLLEEKQSLVHSAPEPLEGELGGRIDLRV